jgi:hypothetical protein
MLMLSAYLLAGSILLPLGDFSLLKDLPRMYRAYAAITSEKPNLVDFVGDYLLSGKMLLGHNKHDAQPRQSTDFQFHHQASPLLVVLPMFTYPTVWFVPATQHYVVPLHCGATLHFTVPLFRPPLA